MIVFPYFITNVLYFVTGIWGTTWSKSSYQEYLQISLRWFSCKCHSLYFNKRYIYAIICLVTSKRISRPCVKTVRAGKCWNCLPKNTFATYSWPTTSKKKWYSRNFGCHPKVRTCVFTQIHSQGMYWSNLPHNYKISPLLANRIYNIF